MRRNVHVYENLKLLMMQGKSLKFFRNTNWKPFGRQPAMAVRDYEVKKLPLIRATCSGGCVVNNGLGDKVAVVAGYNYCPQCIKKKYPDIVFIDTKAKIHYPEIIPEHNPLKLERGGLYATPLFFPNAIPTRFLNDYRSEKCAVETRVVAVCDEGERKQLEKFEHWAPKFFMDLFHKKILTINSPSAELKYYIKHKTLPPITRDDVVSWIESFEPSKRARKYKALDLIDFGLYDLTEAKLFEWQSLVKIQKEHELGSSGPSNPRLIQPCNEVINCLISVFGSKMQRLVEEVFSQKNAKKFDFIFAAGCNATDIKKIFNRLAGLLERGGVVGEGDFSFYDRSQNPSMHAIMIEIYRMFGMSEELLMIRSKQVKAVTKTQHGIKIEQNGTLRSGAFDTCFFNSIINYLSHVWCIARSLTLTPEQVVQKLLIVLMGDDNLFHFYRKPLALDKALRDLGLTTKMKFYTDISLVTFLNLFPILVDGEWNVSLKPGRILSRLSVAVDEQRHMSEYLARIAQGMNECGKNTPLLRILFPELFRMSGITKIQPLWERYHHHQLQTEESSAFCVNQDELDSSFCNRYQITLKQLHNLEDQFAQYLRDNDSLFERKRVALQPRGGFVHPVLDAIFIKDGVYSGSEYE